MHISFLFYQKISIVQVQSILCQGIQVIEISIENIILNMIILKSSDKENRLPRQSGNKTEGLGKFQVPQNQKLSPSVPSICSDSHTQPIKNNVPYQFFENQVKRIKQAYENERKQKWTVNQEKNKLQNQMRTLRAQKESYINENQRLRSELKNFMYKFTDSQTKTNSQLSDYYSFKNQISSLQFSLKRYQDQQITNEQKFRNLKLNNESLQNQVRELNSQINGMINDCKLKDAQIQFLNGQLNEVTIKNKLLFQSSQSQQGSKYQNKQIQKICKQLQNCKVAFERKQEQLLMKVCVLSQEKETLEKTINELSSHLKTIQPSQDLLKSTPVTQNTEKTNNQYYMRLFIKQSQIQKMNKTIVKLEQKIQFLQVQNAILNKKLTQNSIFSPSGYQKYTQVQNAILKNSIDKKQSMSIKDQLSNCQKQIEGLNEKVAQLKNQIQSMLIQRRKLESQLQLQRVYNQNTVRQLESKKISLQRELDLVKSKTEALSKQCQQKDRIILVHVNNHKL